MKSSDRPEAVISVGDPPRPERPSISSPSPTSVCTAITPNGKTAYVTAGPVDNVVPISTATNAAGKPINVPSEALLIAITPDGRTVYVANPGSAFVTPIRTANTPGTAINAGSQPWAIAIT